MEKRRRGIDHETESRLGKSGDLRKKGAANIPGENKHGETNNSGHSYVHGLLDAVYIRPALGYMGSARRRITFL